MNEKKTGAELLASFTVLIGDQDEAGESSLATVATLMVWYHYIH